MVSGTEPAAGPRRPGTITYPGGTLHFGPGQPTLCVNDQMGYIYEDPRVLAELQAGRLDALIRLAEQGIAAGMTCINVQLMHYTLDQRALIPKVIETLVERKGCAIAIDTRDAVVLEWGLRAYQPYKALCNVVNGEWENLRTFLPIIAKYGAAAGTALVYERGIPQTVQERVEVARRIVEAAEACGIPREDVAMDCVCLPSSVSPNSMPVTLRTIQAVHEELGAPTLLGISNAGVMMPEHELLDLAYLIAAVAHGLDVAMVSPTTPLIDGMVPAIDFLSGKDVYGQRYLDWYRRKQGLPSRLAS
ncbi:MAG: dihydropteroate synthase [Anaerolineae bacterium]